MTEESDGEDDTIYQHNLPWRSKGVCYLKAYFILNIHMHLILHSLPCFKDAYFCFFLALNKLVKKLDKRVERSKQNQQGFRKKVRVLKSPAKSAVPPTFPKWAVDELYQAETPSRVTSVQPRKLPVSPPSPSPSQSSIYSSSSLSDSEN